MPRRRSAVVEVFDDSSANPEAVFGAVLAAQKPQHQQKQLSSSTMASASADAAGSQLPARYHGTNQPHSQYYAHGTSTVAPAAVAAAAAAGTYAYRGAKTAAATEATTAAGGPMQRPAGKFHTVQPYAASGRPRRGGMQGLFEHHGPHHNHNHNHNHHSGGGTKTPSATAAVSPSRLPDHAAMTDNTGGAQRHHLPAAATSSIRHPPVHPKPPPHSRRTSLSPVLTALQPGNYHIANLPDIDLDGSSSSSSESEALDTSRPDAVRGRGGNGRANTSSSKLGGNSKAPLSPLPPTSALPLAINTTLLHALQTSHCDTGDSTITPLSVVNVPAGALSTCSTSPSSQASRAGGYDTSRVVPFEHGEQGGIGGSPVIFDAEEYGSSSPSFVVVDADTTTSPVVFDAESLGSDHEEDDTSVLDGNAAAHHFDLVENAVPIEELTTTNAIRGKESDGVDIATAIEEAIREFEVWDAAGEIVRPGNYEVYSGGKSDEMQPGVEPPTTSTLDGNMTLGQQQQLSASTAGSSASSAFKVMGVRHVSTYSPDFDKTAASLLSSIKTDIAKRVATANSSGGGGSAAGGGGGSGEENKRRDFASAASIAAAIEHHQQKKQQQQKQQTGVMEEVGEHRYLHSSRLSGFFGFGQRTQRGGGGNGGNGSGAALQPLSAPQPRGGRAPSPKAAAVAADLRVVTDLQTLRGAGRSGGSNDQITTTTTTGGGEGGAPSSSGDGQKKSSNTSPSATLMARRWRVPFIQRVVSSGDPGDIGSARRRSRGRAGTTSDIESPHAASSAGDNRPFSM
ncbi:hypothetical protein H4S06_004777, partial [Coemansia sp. BCRC 34490]